MDQLVVVVGLIEDDLNLHVSHGRLVSGISANQVANDLSVTG